ncbi:MAG: type II secretion system protein GspD, partial [Phycisphaerae bacterium]
DANRVNLAVDWDDLEANGVERTRPVSLKLRNVTFRTALKEMLSQAGGDVPLGYAATDEVLRVATRHKLDQNKFSQVYDIRDLITDIPKFANSPRLDINAAGNKPINRDVFGSDGQSTSGDFASESAMAERTLSGRTSANRDEGSLTALMDLVRTTVAPDSWRETGGGDAALRELNGQLVVYNTSDAQQQVRDLLTQLRDTRALMIGVEARFLIVGSNFLNEIGVDLDFVFNQGTAGYDPAVTSTGTQVVNPFTGAPVLIPREYSQRGFIPAPPGGVGTGLGQGALSQPYGNAANVPRAGGIAPAFGDMTPIGAQQSSLDLVDPSLLSTGIPGAFGQQANFRPAMNIVGSFLDNLQVDFLIRATQANRRSSIVQAPRLMMFNGQRAWVAVVRSRQYVSSVTATVAEQVAAVAPVVATVQSGTVLDVEGTISNDKKYVTLTVRTGLAQEPIITQFEVQRGSGNSPSIFTSLTDQELRAIRTTVSIPDGGTVLIGGLKQTGEVEVEAGVPILSKIPVLKRAFTNTTTVKDTQTLLILLKAKILIQKEAEDEAFPSFAER